MDSDFLICKAFSQILAKPVSELEYKLGVEVCLDLATYLTRLPITDQTDVAKMANYITEFCQKPETSKLRQWLSELYSHLGIDDIQTLVKKTGDPGDEADSPSENILILENESRDIGQFLQNWATEILSNDEQEVQDDSKSN